MNRVFEELSKVVAGDGAPAFLTAICVLTKGHLLIEDVPGVGKTLLASSVAKACDIDFKRVQCTPDILPGDILGFNMFDINTGNSRYIKGPVMTNLLLVDEINRASSKTQSALLEVMEESKITVDGEVMQVPDPFIVIATQNPIESVGTSPLPEAQLDRFSMKISMGYPDFENEMLILSRFENVEKLPQINPVLNKEEIINMQKNVAELHVDKKIMEYIIKITTATRNHPKISLGCSPRASLVLLKCAKARAFLLGRDYVIVEDVKHLAQFVLAHRLILKSQLRDAQGNLQAQELISEIVKQTSV